MSDKKKASKKLKRLKWPISVDNPLGAFGNFENLK
jgi:hypothetical protein